MAQSITAQLAAFIGTCRIGNMPPEVVARARMFVLDYLGVALTASSSPQVRKSSASASST